MTTSKINKLQQRILNEIASVINNSMSTNDKLKIVSATIDRYRTQYKNLRIEEAIEKWQEVEAKDHGGNW